MTEQQYRKIKIIGSGEGRVFSSWKVLDADGSSIQGIRRVELIADARGVAQAILYIDGSFVEGEIDAIAATKRAEEMTLAERVAGEVVERLRGQLARILNLLGGLPE